MAITFHCEHCGGKVSAPDNAGGRHGRCPACKQVVYIPAPGAGELKLAPIDPEAEQRLKEKVEHDLAAEHDLLVARDNVDESAPDASQPEAEPEAPPELDDPTAEGGVVLPTVDQLPLVDAAADDPREAVVGYLQKMAAGQLEPANAIAESLRANPAAAMQAIQALVSDPLADRRLSDMPQAVLAGFLKQLEHALK